MAVANLDTVLSALQSLAETRLLALDEIFGREAAWLASLPGLLAPKLNGQVVEPPAEILSPSADPVEEVEVARGKARGTVKGRGRGRKAAVAESEESVQGEAKENAGTTKKPPGRPRRAAAATAAAKRPAARRTRTAAAVEDDQEETALSTIADDEGDIANRHESPRASVAEDPPPCLGALETVAEEEEEEENLQAKDCSSPPTVVDMYQSGKTEAPAAKTIHAATEQEDPSVAASDSDASDTSAEPLASAVPPQDASKASPADGSQLDKSTSTATGRYGQSRGLSSATRASSGRRHRTPSAAQMQSSPQVTAAQGTPVVPTVSRSISLTSLMTPRINGTGGENQEEDGENKPQEVSPQLNEGRWQLLCSPVVGKRPLDEATPLEEINEQLRTADKTVSCRKKRPKTPKGFSFDIPASLRFPASAFEPAGAETSGPPQVVPEEAVLETDQPVASEMDREEHQHQEVGEEACSATMHTFGGDSDMGDKVEEGCNGDVDMKDAIPETPEPTEPQPEAPVSQLSAVENGAQEADESTATEVTALEQGGEQRRAELTVEEGVRIGEKAAEEEPPGKAFGNILTGVTSFVLMVKKQQPAAPPPAAGKTKGKVKALEAANAARKEAEAKAAERAKRLEFARLRREQARAATQAGGSKQAATATAVPSNTSAKTCGTQHRVAPTSTSNNPPIGKTDTQCKAEEPEARRRAREEQERKERQERIKQMEEQRLKIREGAQQCEALKQAKEAVPAAQLHKHVHHPGSAAKPSPHGPSRFAQTLSSETTNEAEFSYEISPYKSESESEEDEENPKPKKSIPQWAQSLNVLRALQAQQHKDPDEIFQQKHIKTCNLEEMFHEVTAVASSGGNGKRSHGRRGSSGNWIEDRVTWQEELAYKKNMGFRAFC